MQVIEKTFPTAQIEINYAEGPANGPPLLLLHGQGSVWQDWAPVIDYFEAHWQIFAPDLRGCGRSGRDPDGAYGIDHFADDIGQFIDTLIGRPVAVIGHSLGSMVALHLAARDQHDRIRGVVLEDPPIYLRQFFKTWKWYDYYPVSVQALQAGLDEAQIAARFVEKLGLEAAEAAKEARSLVQIDPQIIYQVMEGGILKGFNAEAELAQVGCPILLMHGEWDLGSVLRPQDITRLSQRLPAGALQSIPGVGHSLHLAQCQPDRFNDAVSTFLESASISWD